MKKLMAVMLSITQFFIGIEMVLGQTQKPSSKVRVTAASFENETGDASMDNLKKIVPDRIIALLVGLSKNSQAEFVERSQLEKAIEEARRAARLDAFDPNNAPQLGKLVGASQILVGSFSKLNEKMITINARLVSVEDGKIIAAEVVDGSQGEMANLYSLLAKAFMPVWGQPSPPPSQAITKKWWFWGVAAVGVGGGIYAAIPREKKAADVSVTIVLP